jgi:dUTP pyrophosphatase
MIKFEKVNRITDDLKLPERSTSFSAGYDFFNPEEVEIQAGQIKYVKTGIKSQFPEDRMLMLCNRSSNPKKKGLILANSVGIVDKDYYGNPDNDGHIMFAFFNFKDIDVEIKKGEAIGQAIFHKYFIADDDCAEGERLGGFGSTSK